MLDLNSDTLIWSKQTIFVIFRNNLNGFWGFLPWLIDHGVGSPKAPTPTPSSPLLTKAFWWPWFHPGNVKF
jgi:hypothetical protein